MDVVRELPPTEYHRLNGVAIFAGRTLPEAADARIIVAEDPATGEITAYWAIFAAVHVEPLWIRDDRRKHPGFARRLWRAVRGVLDGAGISYAFAIIMDADAPENAPLARRLGFLPLPGRLYLLEVALSGPGAHPPRDIGRKDP